MHIRLLRIWRTLSALIAIPYPVIHPTTSIHLMSVLYPQEPLYALVFHLLNPVYTSRRRVHKYSTLHHQYLDLSSIDSQNAIQVIAIHPYLQLQHSASLSLPPRTYVCMLGTILFLLLTKDLCGQ